ncbi:MAG TPA: sigma-54 dependent transcriptional regulator [Candidatus Eisenbacteria bacterium]
MSPRRKRSPAGAPDAHHTRKPGESGVRAPAELAASDPELRGLWEAAPPLVEASRASTVTQNMIGVSPRMQRIFRLIEKVAPTESTVLITGESGTGKEMVATAIHLQSRRAHRPFVVVNAAAVPETLFESELFGHVKGAFTGAIADKRGLLHQADGGTLFLDEVAEMPLAVQAKLLRALQSGEVRRVGAAETLHVDVRVIAATNRDLPRALAEGRLREDLFYRLSVFQIEMPPLRERREDIPLLANYFRQRYARRLGKRVDRFTERAQFYLLRYDYPGNVRELENAVERAVTLAEHGEITHMDLPPTFRDAPIRLLQEGSAFPYTETLSLADLEAEHIRRVLTHFAGNATKAARSLGISRSTLWRKMREYGL